ncbi:GNAT family N-acetyltransferase [Chitinophaga sp. 22321]|uniref:GNAT family N-acetyltransferase n=1 Tax=Chitinophaga hostae TaxID=2831022 RepID=A0ABS5J042_9BACT|nr:GNAT family protein [Chitinophaga hostae]MBS0028593.1 GNAT family N-acetyltransferase [Chitinophaga hostae]
MELTSLRLLLTPVTTADIPVIHRLHSMPETDEYNTLGIPADIAVTADVVNGWLRDADQQVWCITVRDTREFIGLAALVLKTPRFRSAEVWYKLDPAWWGQGLATETVTTLVQYAFDQLNLHRVEAGCAVNNKGSARVLEKSGMQLEGRKRKVLPIRGTWSDNFMYAILAEDRRH